MSLQPVALTRVAMVVHACRCCRSIYGFQGAHGSRAFTAFRQSYASQPGAGGGGGPGGGGARVVCLAQNYRSSGHIVRAAGVLIAHNNASGCAGGSDSGGSGEQGGAGQHGRQPGPCASVPSPAATYGGGRQAKPTAWTAAPDGAQIRLFACRNLAVEATHVAREVSRLVRARGMRYGQIAVLARTARAAAPALAALRAARVPVAVPRANIFELRCVRQLLALLRLVAHTPRPGVGAHALVCAEGERLAREQAAAEAARADGVVPAGQRLVDCGGGAERDGGRRVAGDGARGDAGVGCGKSDGGGGSPKLDADWMTLLKALQPPPSHEAAHTGGRGGGRGVPPAGDGVSEEHHGSGSAVACAQRLARAHGIGIGDAIVLLSRAHDAAASAAQAAKAKARSTSAAKRGSKVGATAAGADGSGSSARKRKRRADGGGGVEVEDEADEAAAQEPDGAGSAEQRRIAAARAAVCSLRPAHAAALSRAVNTVATLRERVEVLKLGGLVARAVAALPLSGRFLSRPAQAATDSAPAGGTDGRGRGGGAALPQRAGAAAVAAAARAVVAATAVGAGGAAGQASVMRSGGGERGGRGRGSCRGSGAHGGVGAASSCHAVLLEDGDERSVIERLLAGTEADASNGAQLQQQYAALQAHALSGNIGGAAGESERVLRLRSLLDDLAQREAEEEELQRARETDAVALSTVHAAKGLEWDAVFVLRANEGEFPLSRRVAAPVVVAAAEGGGGAGRASAAEAAERAHEEEERRLAYVAVTRARALLFVSYAEQDESSGEVLRRSRFVDEIASARSACAPTEPIDELIAQGDEQLFAAQPNAAPPRAGVASCVPRSMQHR